MEVAIFFITSIYPFVPSVPSVANSIYPFVPSVPLNWLSCTPLVAHCTSQKGFSTASATMMIAMNVVTELTVRK